MVSHKTLGNFFVIGMLVFLLLNTSSLGLTQDNLQSSRQEPIPSVFGVFGQNQWYISAVTISFEYDPQRVFEIQYKLDDVWNIYDDPFDVTNDGVYMIPWFWVDEANNSNNGGPIEFKIDKTPPTIDISRKVTGKNKVIFTAEAVDTASGIIKVDFYLDDVLNITDDESPYEYTWTGEETQVVYAITYNYAGFMAQSDNLTTVPRPRLRTHYLIDLFFTLIQKTFFRFY